MMPLLVSSYNPSLAVGAERQPAAAQSPTTLTPEECVSKTSSAGRVRQYRTQSRGALLLLLFVLEDGWREKR